ncbi:hypothetical protein [Parasitella parasitica]|uniref:protein-serine/threonine phosphatase n=1 Tax=Parasitella parasitica TaxID=35722 RepID=A0A0B7MP43_9FUNG|nr:hypothetical protein [Parasitella parasitica]
MRTGCLLAGLIGANVAKYSSKNLSRIVIESADFEKGNFKDALRKGFLQIDEDLRAGIRYECVTRILERISSYLHKFPQKDPEYEHETSGCTAIVALLTKDNELDGEAIPLSEDHKPGNPKETERIEKAGGHVEFGRVNGNLALSRALGDFDFKNANVPAQEQAVTADPDITMRKITHQDEFMVLACDGIWDCLSNAQVAAYVRKHVANNVPLKEICERLMDSCLADSTSTGGVGCDNMTVEIVAFLNGQTEDKWYAKIRESVAAVSPMDIVNSIDSPQKETDDNDSDHDAGGMKSESRQYSVDELRNAPSLTSSLSDPQPERETEDRAG